MGLGFRTSAAACLFPAAPPSGAHTAFFVLLSLPSLLHFLHHRALQLLGLASLHPYSVLSSCCSDPPPPPRRAEFWAGSLAWLVLPLPGLDHPWPGQTPWLSRVSTNALQTLRRLPFCPSLSSAVGSGSLLSRGLRWPLPGSLWDPGWEGAGWPGGSAGWPILLCSLLRPPSLSCPLILSSSQLRADMLGASHLGRGQGRRSKRVVCLGVGRGK